MKKFCSLLLALSLSVAAYAAAPWGLAADYEQNPLQKSYGMPKVVSRQPIYYFVNSSNEKGIAALQQIALRQIAVQEAFKAWFSYTKNTIEQAGRSGEFADIMVLLNNGPYLQTVNDPEKADIVITFTSLKNIKEECGDDALGCYTDEGKIYVPSIQVNNNMDQNTVLIHEVGHFFGLADQYTDVNTSIIYSTSNRIRKDLSIMSVSKGLGCDDADGLINAIDWTRAYLNDGHYSARASKGWKSFCDNTIYRKSKVLNRPETVIKDCIYKFDAASNVSRQICPDPFMFHPDKELYLTDAGGVGKLVDSDQDLVTYYSYRKVETPEPTLISFTYRGEEENPLMRLQAQRQVGKNNKVQWDFPYRGIAQVVLEGEECTPNIGRDIGGFEFEYVTLDMEGIPIYSSYNFDRNTNQPYKGDHRNVLTDVRAKFSVHAEDMKGRYQCRISLGETENALIYTKKGLRDFDEAAVAAVGNKYDLSEKQIIEAGALMCDKNRLFPKRKLDDMYNMCLFFSFVEESYQKMHK